MSELITAARPYARAVFEFARDNDAISSWGEQIQYLAAMVAVPEMQQVIDNPRLTKSRIAELFVGAADGHIDDHGANLVRLLAENGKLVLLPEIAALFEQYRDEAEGLVEVEVTSAMPMDAEQEQRIAKALKKRFGRDVKITTQIDESLMGGAVIRAGDLVIDGSLKGRLDKAATVLSR